MSCDHFVDENGRGDHARLDSLKVSYYINVEDLKSNTFGLSEPSDGNLSYLLKYDFSSSDIGLENH